ncbi:hypothetical protein niasHS_004367 [Heterodera schachtii]|uniref:peptidylprolyl isomerase n=1 Tax=Heterodera schachtii TaxID=97005 RepID=A0ABD2K0K1_HETSC
MQPPIIGTKANEAISRHGTFEMIIGLRRRDGIKSDQVLHYIVQLVDLFRPTPGPRWCEEDGLEIEVVGTFDSVHFRLHHGKVITGGMDRAMTSMCEGERLRVVIPAALGYGDKGRDNIPGGATLYFDIELHKLIKPSADEL